MVRRGTRKSAPCRPARRAVRNFFAHRMTTYATALAYRGLFGPFPFALLTAVLLGVLDLDGYFRGSLEQARSEFQRQDPGVLVPVLEEARKQAGRGLLGRAPWAWCSRTTTPPATHDLAPRTSPSPSASPRPGRRSA